MTDPIHGDKPHGWMALANCAGLPTEWFFPERGDNIGADSNTAQARAVCARCEVRAECDAYAIADPPERWGLWGGRSAFERGTRSRRRAG